MSSMSDQVNQVEDNLNGSLNNTFFYDINLPDESFEYPIGLYVTGAYFLTGFIVVLFGVLWRMHLRKNLNTHFQHHCDPSTVDFHHNYSPKHYSISKRRRLLAYSYLSFSPFSPSSNSLYSPPPHTHTPSSSSPYSSTANLIPLRTKSGFSNHHTGSKLCNSYA